MKDYIAILEQATDGTWGAYVPDLPGCTSFGFSRNDISGKILEAIQGHIDALRETGQVVPEPRSIAEIVHVA